nr:unnamed protein product [Digitaria exilis]
MAPSPSLLVSTALKSGVSYASGGAGILDSTNAGNNIPLSKQVQYMNGTRAKMVAAAGSAAVDTLLAKSFFLIGIGGNDLFAFANAEQARNRRATSHQAFYDDGVSRYTKPTSFKQLIYT